jgi:hypothetical protein
MACVINGGDRVGLCFGGTCRLHLQGRGNNAREEECYTVTNRYRLPARLHILEDIIVHSPAVKTSNLN